MSPRYRPCQTLGLAPYKTNHEQEGTATDTFAYHLSTMPQPVALQPSKRSSSHPRDLPSRLLAFLRLLFHSETPLKVGDAPSHTTSVPDRPESFPPEVDRSLPMDPNAASEHLVELVHHLQLLLPGTCEWLGEGTLEVVGNIPSMLVVSRMSGSAEWATARSQSRLTDAIHL